MSSIKELNVKLKITKISKYEIIFFCKQKKINTTISGLTNVCEITLKYYIHLYYDSLSSY